MHAVAIQEGVVVEKRHFPLRNAKADIRIDLDVVDTAVATPDEALRHMAANLLEDLARQLRSGKAGKVTSTSTTANRALQLRSPEAGASPWEPFDLHMKEVKSVHGIIQAISELTLAGKPATPALLHDKAGYSLPTIYKVLDPETAVGKYAKPLILVTKEGKTRNIDLTSAGKLTASKVRAGSFPA